MREATPNHLLPPLSRTSVFPTENIRPSVVGIALGLRAVYVFEGGFEFGCGDGGEAEFVRGRGVLFGDGWAGVEDCAEGVEGQEEGARGGERNGACLEGVHL